MELNDEQGRLVDTDDIGLALEHGIPVFFLAADGAILALEPYASSEIATIADFYPTLGWGERKARQADEMIRFTSTEGLARWPITAANVEPVSRRAQNYGLRATVSVEDDALRFESLFGYITYPIPIRRVTFGYDSVLAEARAIELARTRRLETELIDLRLLDDEQGFAEPAYGAYPHRIVTVRLTDGNIIGLNIAFMDDRRTVIGVHDVQACEWNKSGFTQTTAHSALIGRRSQLVVERPDGTFDVLGTVTEIDRSSVGHGPLRCEFEERIGRVRQRDIGSDPVFAQRTRP